MGKGYSHLNAWALSAILRFQEEDLRSIATGFYTKGHSSELDNAHEISEGDLTIKLQDEMGFYPTDVEVLLNFFHLNDNKNRGVVDIRKYLVSLSPISCSSIPCMFLFSLNMMDYKNEQFISKRDLHMIVRLINDSLRFLGDKSLTVHQVDDLVDSVYTAAGKIDGDLFYPDFIEYLSNHPMVQLLTSVQFQGTIQSKLMDEEAIEKMTNLY